MLCLLRDVARIVWDFIIHDVLLPGGTWYAYKLSLKKKRIAPPPETPSLEHIGDAAGQPTIDLQEPFVTPGPRHTTPDFHLEDFIRNATQIQPHIDSPRSLSVVDYTQEDTLVAPGQLFQGTILLLCLIGSVTYLLSTRSQARAATARAENVEKKLHTTEEKLSTTENKLDATEKKLAATEKQLVTTEQKLDVTDGAFESLLGQFRLNKAKADALRQKNKDRKVKAKTKARKKSWRWQELNDTHRAKVLDLESQNRSAHDRIKALKSERGYTKVHLAQVEANNATLRHEVTNIEAKAKASALRSERLTRRTKDTFRKAVRELKHKESSTVKDFEVTLSKSNADIKAQQSTISDLQKATAGLQERLGKEERDNRIIRAALEQSQTGEAFSG